MLTSYQVAPAHQVAGNPAGSILELEATDPTTIAWLDSGAITTSIDPTLSPDWFPNASGFYHQLAASAEYAELITYAANNPAPAQALLTVAIASTLEAKSWQESAPESSKRDVDFARVEAMLSALVVALPDEVGATTKAEIITAINTIASANSVPLTLS
jgi:hypothetical protein